MWSRRSRTPNLARAHARAWRDLWHRPLTGPATHTIETFIAHTLEEYLSLCKILEDRSADEQLFYRGQTKEYFLDDGVTVSLKPVCARSPKGGPPPIHLRAFQFQSAYLEYIDDAIDEHIRFASRSPSEERALRQFVTQPQSRIFGEGAAIDESPFGRFLLFLYGPRRTLFEAALQHYGWPTLSLDVTYSPLVALYFAATRIRRRRDGVAHAERVAKGGAVYLLDFPEKGISIHGQPMNRFSLTDFHPTGLRVANLFELMMDNEIRPRRQYAAMLAEAAVVYFDSKYHAHVADQANLNCYSDYIRHRILFAPEFWNASDTQEFLKAPVGAWLFPPEQIDTLLRRLRSVDGLRIPTYDVGTFAVRHPAHRLELCKKWRIVLTGPDAANVRKRLLSTWFDHVGHLELMPLREVMRLADDKSVGEIFDVVVSCDEDPRAAQRMSNKILSKGEAAGKLFVGFATFVRGKLQNRERSMTFKIGDQAWISWDDNYDFTYYIQKMIFDAIIYLSRLRYEDVVKPDPKDWRRFLDLVNSADPASTG
jgi:hypothetical protein